ncbi:MAG: protein translocase subunit SecDF [Flavobacteriaceae bacterium]
MQNRGLIKLFAILFGLVSLYQLSFTYFTSKVEGAAEDYAYARTTADNGRELARLEQQYLDSVGNEPAMDLGVASFTYNDIKDKEINLGLDLKGGINAILQVSVKDILIGLSNDSKNPTFRQALDAADLAQKSSDKPYADLFFEAFDNIGGGTAKLSDPSIFGNKSLRDKINFQMSNSEVEPIIEGEIDASISTAFQVLRSRIDKFGVTQPNIQRIGNSGRILIELPGAKDISRVEKLLQSTAELQFWEVYNSQETAAFFFQANEVIQEKLNSDTEDNASEEQTVDDLLGEVQDSIVNQKNLFSVLQPNIPQAANQISSMVGFASVRDTAKVNEYLAMPEVRAELPAEMRYVKFLWDAKPNKDTDVITLYAIKGNRQNQAPIEGDVINDAVQSFDQFGVNPEVSMNMNSAGTKLWAKLTTDNVGNFVAVVLDDYVYTAPRVNDAITTGRTSISGNFTVEEAQDLANVLKAGKLPAAANIIQSEVVGPSLGQEAIESGLSSFGIALVLVLIWMIFYYGKAGGYADIALLTNLLFIFGILTAFGAVLTLPGIAGIVLTIGMSVDANVLIFERIKEEFAKGKGQKEGIEAGFNNALSSILDANVTTMLTGIILYVFGTGPVKGFAYTLMVGIVTSLFSAIFITRLLIDKSSNKGTDLTFNTNITKNWFTNINFDFLKARKKGYIISGIVIALGIGSLMTNSLNYGVDFVGGRSYVVRFDHTMNASDVAANLKDEFGSAPEVKTYGTANQLKITTKYRIEETGPQVDEAVAQALYDGVKADLPEGTTLDQFKGGFDGQTVGIYSYMKVEPTIADDIKTAAGWAVIGSLIVVFLYILIRFRKWQFSLGAVAAVFHDILIVLSVFSITYKWMPFDMEIGQSFIAALLTVVGYSLNDTVVIFDRIREYTKEFSKSPIYDTINKALCSTLGRTINTSLTTLVVLLAIFFFGGDSIRGFMFALIVGVLVGTYSSLFIATPVMYDTTKKVEAKKKA